MVTNLTWATMDIDGW